MMTCEEPTMLPNNLILQGSEDLPAERIELAAGPLSMAFEPDTGFLRYVRMGDHEVLRGIYVAVRDSNWGTVEPEITVQRLEQGENAFGMTFRAVCQAREIDFTWTGRIEGTADGTLVFSMDGEARSTFLRNRIGFCLLHPAACAGVRCRVERVDGSMEEGAFPEAISAHQPFMDIRAISHEVASDCWAEVRFEGDTFEMEDQRNWTDASYKTYCTPLGLPFPVEVPAGTTVRQSVTLSTRGALSGSRSGDLSRPATVTLTVPDEEQVALPSIGLGSASHGQALSHCELRRLRALGLGHLRVDLHLGDAGYPEAFRRATLEADALGVALEVALFLTEDYENELRGLRDRAERARPQVGVWLIHSEGARSTNPVVVRTARKVLADCCPNARYGGGTDAYFTELNRDRPPVEVLDLVCYSINPQVHAFDNASLVETLQTQACTVESAQGFAQGLPVAVSPLTLSPRYNPNATGEAAELAPGELPPEVDVRQMSLLGAAWTLGSLKYLSESGASRITCYETTGWRGVMETEAGSPLPEVFRSIPGSVFPLYHLLADVGEFAGGQVLPCRSSASLTVDGLVLSKGDRVRVMVANMGPTETTVRIEYGSLGRSVRVKRLDASNAEHAMVDPEGYREDRGELRQVEGDRVEVELPPYSIIRVDRE
jgi:D-apionolactonase